MQFYEVALLLNQKLDVEVTAESGAIQKVRRIVPDSLRQTAASGALLFECADARNPLKFESGRSVPELHQCRQRYIGQRIFEGSIPAPVRDSHWPCEWNPGPYTKLTRRDRGFTGALWDRLTESACAAGTLTARR